MKGEEISQIVPNSETVYEVVPVYEGHKIVELYSTPIIAWCIKYFLEEECKNNCAIVQHITTEGHCEYGEDYAIYYPESYLWTDQSGVNGKGKDNLLKHFIQRQAARVKREKSELNLA